MLVGWRVAMAAKDFQYALGDIALGCSASKRTDQDGTQLV